MQRTCRRYPELGDPIKSTDPLDSLIRAATELWNEFEEEMVEELAAGHLPVFRPSNPTLTDIVSLSHIPIVSQQRQKSRGPTSEPTAARDRNN